MHPSTSLTSLDILAALASALLPAATAAQSVVKLNGQIFDGNGGPFKSGTVYWIKSDGGACCGAVPAGKTLTIEKGAMVKFQGNSLTVSGTLIARKATFTALEDDAVGGDTNGDGGQTTPTRGSWDRITFGAGSTGVLEDCTLRWGGMRGAPTLHLRGNPVVTMTRIKVLDGGGPGINAEHAPARLTDSEIADCDGTAVVGWTWYRCEDLVDNIARRNKGGDFVLLGSVSLPNWPRPTVTMDRAQTMNGNGVFVLATSLTGARVLQNHKLVIPKGLILKFQSRSALHVTGDLQVQGTGSEEVVMTAFADDIGGDTNQDGGASTPQPGAWQGLRFVEHSQSSRLDHAHIAYGGESNRGGIDIFRAGITLRSTIVAHALNDGVTINGSGFQAPTFADCDFVDNGGVAASGVRFETIAGSSGSRATGQGRGDYFVVGTTRVEGGLQLDIRPENYPGAALVLDGRAELDSTSRLSLHAGVILKLTSAGSGSFAGGTFECLGTGRAPVVMTSLQDDSIGGDTNLDGSSTRPLPGDWRGVSFTSASGRLEHTHLRYAGGSSTVALSTGSSSRLTFAAVRIDHAAQQAVQLWTHVGPLDNLVIDRAGGPGLVITGGDFDVVHATITGCSGIGLSVGGGYTGTVHNSIVWNNSGGNLAGIKEAQVMRCNGGFAGKNGNLLADPGFVAPATGDLRLRASSPCLDRAGMTAALATVEDHLEFSRILDHALTGVAVPDIGAFERSAYSLDVDGAPALGRSISFRIQGPAGNGQLYLGILNGAAFLPPFGFVLLGLNPVLPVSSNPVGATTVLAIPNSASLAGIRFGIQGIAMPTTNPTVGAMTDLYRGEVR